ncbi:MAG: heme exporter protein CcmB, partial [Hyphomicrobiales bacterium]|nr:heme exporter protein CcmB [Hyphomicrobiales bacterium]
MSVLKALIRRDLMLAWRQGGGTGTALGFFLTVVVLLPLGIGPDQALLQRIAPGALWIALLLSVLLSAERIFQPDYDDGSLEQMALGPAPLEMITIAKAFAHWLSAGLPLAIAAPLLGFLLNLDPALILPLGIAMFIGSLALSLLACLGAAITVGLRRGGMLVSL